MASLVQFLASGVNGASNGSATFVLRGTASSAASVLYNDFEETSQPGTNVITLDANGAAEIYCDAYCDVTLKNSAGSTLRTVTIGHSASMIEVVSDSFTGTSYSGSPTEASQPATLASILDKWDNSAGADDWQVLVNGVATNISTAFSALAGLFFNVKDSAYGAVGDGVTDDTSAIGLAISAASSAGGGIVFFPASTSSYKVTNLTVSASNITLMGTGPRSSVISSSSTSGPILSLTNNTLNSWKRIIGLGFNCTGANSNPVIRTDNDQTILIDNTEITASDYTGALMTRTADAGTTFITIRDSRFNIEEAQANGLLNASSDGDANWVVKGCKFVIGAGFEGNVIDGPDFQVSDCVFDGSAVTSGICAHVAPSSNDATGRYLGRYTNNLFIDGGSDSVVFNIPNVATGSDLFEDCNRFSGFSAPTTVSETGSVYSIDHVAHDAASVYLGSRKGRAIELSLSSTGAIDFDAGVAFEHVFVNYTGAGNITLTINTQNMSAGSQLTITILNSSGSTRDITVNVGESVQTYFGNGSDSTVSAADGDHCIIHGIFTQLGSGAPAFLILSHLED